MEGARWVPRGAARPSGPLKATSGGNKSSGHGYLGMGGVLDTPGCSEMARGPRQPDPQGNFFIDQ